MKISLAISINEKQPLLISGLQMRMSAPETVIQWMLPLLPPTVIVEELGNAGSKVKKETGWPQIAGIHMKGRNSVSPEACIFPCIEY